ncbi:uncharacterized protein LOC115284781, partial [Suricata suricatta]|uniref:uncharacterized protein LOC115284781 n=1 Tax=Suricata suricatta TaxID=37032 RepID=UPI0011560BA2
EEEGQSARADPRVASRGHRGLPGPQASRPLEERVPGIGASAKEKARSQPDLTPPERPRQAKKKGSAIKPLEDRKDTKPKTTTPKSQANKEFMKQNIKEKQLQKILRSSETDKGSQKPPKVEKILPAHRMPGLSIQPAGGAAPIQLPDGTGAAGPPPTAPETSERRRGERAPDPGGEVAVTQLRKGRLGRQVPEGVVKAPGEVLEGQAAGRSSKPLPAPEEGVLEDEAAVLEPQAGAGRAKDPAPPGGPPGTQGIPPLALSRTL